MFRKKQKWHVCAGKTVNKEWAKGVTTIEEVGLMPGTQCIEGLEVQS